MPIHRTAIFTLHRPTRQVRAALDRAFAHYTAAYTVALRCFAGIAPVELRAMAAVGVDATGRPVMNSRLLEQHLFAQPPKALVAAMAPLEGGIRESLRRHVARTILSYAALALRAEDAAQRADEVAQDRKTAPTWPQRSAGRPTRLRPHDVERLRREGLLRLARCADDREEELTARNLLQMTAQPPVVPIPFCRIDPVRNCGLFYNPDTRRFYARLFVLSYHSRRARRIEAAGRYVDLRSGEVYMREADASHWESIRSFGIGRSSILVSLEIGRWHEEVIPFTRVALLPQRGQSAIPAATPVSAWLVKRGDAYRLHVTFRLPDPPPQRPATLLGVDRGIVALAAGAVVSADGRQIIETFRVDGGRLATAQRRVEREVAGQQRRGAVVRGHRRTRLAIGEVNACANRIAELALRHRAQVVVEDLRTLAAPCRPNSGAEGRRHNHVLPEVLLSRRQYQRLLHAVNDRLRLVGLPRAREVSSWYTSQTCSRCGHAARENRTVAEPARFACTACGHQTDADVQAGLNVARKSLWLARRLREWREGVAKESRVPWSEFVRSLAHSDTAGAKR